jgi:hypothetical protein
MHKIEYYIKNIHVIMIKFNSKKIGNRLLVHVHESGKYKLLCMDDKDIAEQYLNSKYDILYDETSDVDSVCILSLGKLYIKDMALFDKITGTSANDSYIEDKYVTTLGNAYIDKTKYEHINIIIRMNYIDKTYENCIRIGTREYKFEIYSPKIIAEGKECHILYNGKGIFIINLYDIAVFGPYFTFKKKGYLTNLIVDAHYKEMTDIDGGVMAIRTMDNLSNFMANLIKLTKK